MAAYYAGTRGMGRGSVRALRGVEDGVVIRYQLTQADQRNLSIGLAHLGEILFAAGAKAVYPSVAGAPVLRSAEQCRGLLKQPIPLAAMSLSSVHAFSSCPMGENPDLCATDSFGRVHGFRNLYVNDASLIPDAPGVNPQGTTMAIACATPSISCGARGERRRYASVETTRRPRPDVLVTGAPGWLGTRLVETLVQGSPEVAAVAARAARVVRCLVRPSRRHHRARRPGVRRGPRRRRPDRPAVACASSVAAPRAPRSFTSRVSSIPRASRATSSASTSRARGTCSRPRRRPGCGASWWCRPTRRSAAIRSPSHLFDERSPYHPYMGYGRSKARMEAIVHEVQARGRARDRDHPSAVVLRSASAAPPDALLHHDQGRQVPGPRRRDAAALDGVRRQHLPGLAAGGREPASRTARPTGSPTSAPTPSTRSSRP